VWFSNRLSRRWNVQLPIRLERNPLPIICQKYGRRGGSSTLASHVPHALSKFLWDFTRSIVTRVPPKKNERDLTGIRRNFVGETVKYNLTGFARKYSFFFKISVKFLWNFFPYEIQTYQDVIMSWSGAIYQPSTLQRCRSEKRKKIEDLLNLVLSQFKNIISPWKPEILLFRHFTKLKIAYISLDKILWISLKLNFTPNTLGYYGLISDQETANFWSESDEDLFLRSDPKYRNFSNKSKLFSEICMTKFPLLVWPWRDILSCFDVEGL